jgi:hypothetical protein
VWHGDAWQTTAVIVRGGAKVFLCCLALALPALLPASAGAQPEWLRSAEIVVPADLENQDCRTGVCKHNENTDLNPRAVPSAEAARLGRRR